MKKTIPSALRAWLRFAFFTFVIGACFLMILAFITGFCQSSHYFSTDTPFPTVSLIFASLAGLIGIIDAILSPATNIAHKNDIKITPLFACIGFLAAGMECILTALSGLETVCGILLIISAAHCVFSFLNKEEYQLLNFYLGCAAVISCALLTICLYFDMTIEMNAPIKVLPQIALLCSTLYYTAELRPLVNRAAPRAYRTLCAITVAVGSIASLPIIIACCLGRILREGVLRTDILCAAILLLGITTTAILRLISLYRYDQKQENEAVLDEESSMHDPI